MRKGMTFETARALAIASLGWMPGLPILGGRSAHAAPAPTQPDTGTGGPSSNVVNQYQLLDGFWEIAWGIDFSAGESSMLLWESLAPDIWVVQAVDSAEEDPFVAQGFFYEAGREHLDYLTMSPDDLFEAGLLSADHYFVAGVLAGATGFQTPAVSMLVEITAPGENPEDEPVVVRVLSPVELTPDIETALDEIYLLSHLYEADPDNQLGLPTPAAHGVDYPKFTTSDEESEEEENCDPPNTCPEQHNLCIDSCLFNAIARDVGCTGFAAGCIATVAITCSASTLGFPICFSIGAGGCLAVELACLASSHLLLKACLTDCLIDRLMCESA